MKARDPAMFKIIFSWTEDIARRKLVAQEVRK
jgi:hypothetical protein